MFGWLKRIIQETKDAINSKTEQHVKQALFATVIRACVKCGAAGVDKYGRDVGPKCPKCGAKRPKTENLGRIWTKYR